ncbi:hydroxyacylglutathione hydrolase family protein [Oligoflexia bacterium]|nr:hydroxyacylglutathione hydrolase family protein [Oligoflexia bacterium]
MIFEQIPVGGDRNYSYVIADEASGEAAVVDPAYRVNRITNFLKEHNLTVRYIINTHGHSDHTNGNAALKEETGASIVAHNTVACDKGVGDGEMLKLGGLELKFIYTPGHTTDSLCVLVEKSMCTGDTLFVGKVGGTGLGDDARAEWDSLHKLMALPDDIEVYPGHNYGVAASSTIGNEKQTNPFLLQKSFEEFVDLKQNWAAYKKKHRIA